MKFGGKVPPLVVEAITGEGQKRPLNKKLQNNSAGGNYRLGQWAARPFNVAGEAGCGLSEVRSLAQLSAVPVRSLKRGKEPEQVGGVV